MSIPPVINFIILLSCFDCRKVQLNQEDDYAISVTSYAEFYNTKVVDNGVLYHLEDFQKF